MVYNIAWDESQPDGSEAANTIDTEIQQLKESIRERLEDLIPDWDDDGVDPKVLALPSNERALLTLNSSITVATATVTPIDWESEDLDEGGLVDLGANPSRITIVNTGFYLLSAGCEWQSGSTGERILSFRLNGTGVLARHALEDTSPTSLQLAYQSLQWMGLFTAADYLEVTAYQSTAGDLNFNADQATYFSAIRLA
jgi:hypothetical protein